MAVRPDGTVELYDENGTLRVRLGNLAGNPEMTNVAHITEDGQYVIGDVMSPEWYRPDNLSRLANTYPGHQAWCMSSALSRTWYTIPVAGLAFSRWDSVAEKDVPECVRLAEMLR